MTKTKYPSEMNSGRNRAINSNAFPDSAFDSASDAAICSSGSDREVVLRRRCKLARKDERERGMPLVRSSVGLENP